MEPNTLSPLMQRFILHFGEMGSRWGINRTVGQIYALLYVQAKQLNADEKHAQKRMREMYDLIELSSSWFDDVQRLSPETLSSLMKMGSKIKKLLDVKDKFRFSSDKTGSKTGKDATEEEFSESPTKE